MKKNYLLIGILFLGLSQVFAQAEFNTGTLEVVLSSAGRIRLYTPPPDEVRQIERVSLLVGVSNEFVFDYNEDADAVESAVLVSDPQKSDYELRGLFDNSFSDRRPDVQVEINVYGWQNKSYALFKYLVQNKEDATMNAVIGLDIIPFLNETYGGDAVAYDETNNFIRFYRDSDLNVGFKALTKEFTSLSFFEWFSGYSNDNNYWGWMTSGQIAAPYASTTDDGLVAVTGQPAVDIEPNGVYEVNFALAIGNNEEELIANMAEAKYKFDEMNGSLAINDQNPNGLSLGNNYPNPFSGQTMISYSLPSSGNVSLKVHDQLGRVVAVPVNGVQSAGAHKAEFNSGKLAPGLYFYTLTFNERSITQKMIITD